MHGYNPRIFRAANDSGGDSGQAGGDDVVKALEAATAKALALEQRLAAIDAEKAAAAAEAAAKRGEFEGLYKTEKQRADEAAARLKTYEEREAARAADLDKANKQRIKDIPEARRTLVPEGLDPVTLDAYLTRNMAALKGEDAAAGGRSTAGALAGDDDAKIEREHPDIADDAKRRGMGPAAWYKILIKSGQIKNPAQA